MLGSTLRDRGDLDEAETLYRNGLRVSTALFGAEHIETEGALFILALALARRGELEEAERLARQDLALGDKNFGASNVTRWYRLGFLGAIRLDRGDPAEAEGLLRQALASARRTAPADDPDLADVLNRLAYLLVRRGASDADQAYREAVEFDASRPPGQADFVTDGIHDSIDDQPLVVSTHFTRGPTSGTIVSVPAGATIFAQPGGWATGVSFTITAVPTAQPFARTRIQLDGKQTEWQSPLFFCGLSSPCTIQLADPPAQTDVEMIGGGGEMVALLNGQTVVITVQDGGFARITEYTNSAGTLVDLTVAATGAVLFNGVPLPAGATTAIGKLQATLKVSNGKTRSVNLAGTFTPSPSSNGLNPLTEQMAVKVGQYQWIIAAGSFRRATDGAYLYDGTIGGVQVSVQLKSGKGGVWTFQVNANGIGALATPTAIGLVVGNDAGAATL